MSVTGATKQRSTQNGSLLPKGANKAAAHVTISADQGGAWHPGNRFPDPRRSPDSGPFPMPHSSPGPATPAHSPTQDFINRVAKHTDEIYVTSLCVDYENDEFTSFNGNIVITSTELKIGVDCSNNNVILKDTDWFKENRSWPDIAQTS